MNLTLFIQTVSDNGPGSRYPTPFWRVEKCVGGGALRKKCGNFYKSIINTKYAIFCSILALTNSDHAQ